jgi:hypothetical protein
MREKTEDQIVEKFMKGTKLSVYESEHGPGTLIQEGAHYLFVYRGGPRRFQTEEALNKWLASEGFTLKGNGRGQH